MRSSCIHTVAKKPFHRSAQVEKGTAKLLLITSPNADRFPKFCHSRTRPKLAIKSSASSPPRHPKRATTLHSDTLLINSSLRVTVYETALRTALSLSVRLSIYPIYKIVTLEWKPQKTKVPICHRCSIHLKWNKKRQKSRYFLNAKNRIERKKQQYSISLKGSFAITTSAAVQLKVQTRCQGWRVKVVKLTHSGTKCAATEKRVVTRLVTWRRQCHQVIQGHKRSLCNLQCY